MSTLKSISVSLVRIRQALLVHPVFTRGTGVPVDDPAFTREVEELDRMSERLDILIRNVRNHQQLASAQEQGLWNIARERRYAPASAVRHQQAEAESLMRAAAELRELLDELMRRNGMVSDGDIADKVGEIIKQWHERAHSFTHAGHVSNPNAPSYLPAGHFEATPEAATIAVYAALRALAYFLKKRQKGRAA
ncbi:MAG: hypothetical protein ABSA78_16410 [Candidatus Sulfotelmatobacter sp.]